MCLLPEDSQEQFPWGWHGCWSLGSDVVAVLLLFWSTPGSPVVPEGVSHVLDCLAQNPMENLTEQGIPPPPNTPL